MTTKPSPQAYAATIAVFRYLLEIGGLAQAQPDADTTADRVAALIEQNYKPEPADAAHNPAVLELTRLIAEATAARDVAHAAGHQMTAAAYEIDRRILDEMRTQLAHHLSFDPADLAAARARVQDQHDA